MATYKVILRPDCAAKSGKCPVWLQVFLGKGVRVRIPLGFSVEPRFFDAHKAIIKKMTDKELTDNYNAIINKAKSKCDRIFSEAIWNGIILDKNLLLSEYYAEGVSRKSFTQFFEKAIDNDVTVSANTLRSWRSALGHFKGFRQDVTFGDLRLDTIEAFNKYLLGKKCDTNTLHKYHRTVKRFVFLAIAKGNKIENPYKFFKLVSKETDMEFLTIEELMKLKDLYEAKKLEATEQKVLRCYLFSATCNGLRFGDMAGLSPEAVHGELLSFTPAKTAKIKKNLTVKLSEYGRKLIADALDEKQRVRKTIFAAISNQKTNEYMKKIAALAGIDKKCSFHSARHTFATIFLESGGDIVMLKSMLGHSSIVTTQRYTHVTHKKKVEAMDKFDNFLNSFFNF